MVGFLQGRDEEEGKRVEGGDKELQWKKKKKREEEEMGLLVELMMIFSGLFHHHQKEKLVVEIELDGCN